MGDLKTGTIQTRIERCEFVTSGQGTTQRETEKADGLSLLSDQQTEFLLFGSDASRSKRYDRLIRLVLKILRSIAAPCFVVAAEVMRKD